MTGFFLKMDLFAFAHPVDTGKSPVYIPNRMGVMMSIVFGAAAVALAYFLYLSNAPVTHLALKQLSELPSAVLELKVQLRAFSSHDGPCPTASATLVTSSFEGLSFKQSPASSPGSCMYVRICFTQ